MKPSQSSHVSKGSSSLHFVSAVLHSYSSATSVTYASIPFPHTHCSSLLSISCPRHHGRTSCQCNSCTPNWKATNISPLDRIAVPFTPTVYVVYIYSVCTAGLAVSATNATSNSKSHLHHITPLHSINVFQYSMCIYYNGRNHTCMSIYYIKHILLQRTHAHTPAGTYSTIVV